jgi:hypothetical protein
LYRSPLKVLLAFAVLAVAVDADASTVSAARWSETRCKATLRSWERHHRNASSLQKVSMAGVFDRRHGCRLPLPRKATPPPATPHPTASAPAPPPPAAPVTATPVPPAPTLPDPTTVTTYPMSNASEGITAGTQECISGQIFRGYPLVNSPTGTWVYAIDKLYARPSDGSAGWHVDQSGGLHYNGTHRPVFDWYDEHGQVGSGAMDTWNITSGWTVTIVQFVWDAGVWYHSDETECSF